MRAHPRSSVAMPHFLIRTILLLSLLFPAARMNAESTGYAGESGNLLPDLVPAYILEVPDSIGDILVADAGAARLWRFAMLDGQANERDQRYMSIGINGVGKRKAWDRRTPLGIYFITERLDTSRMHEKYGVAAFPLDYPNAWDRYHRRTGDGIWLHGVDKNNPERPPLDTDGCLSLPNDELTKIADDLKPQVTPVIVARDMELVSRGELRETRLAFRRVLDAWRQSQEQGDVLAYLSMYSQDFRFGDLDKNEWAEYRFAVFEERELNAIELEDVLLMADPEEPGLFLSRFTQVLTTAGNEVRTTKRLYWKRDEANWTIISEDAG